MTEFKVGDELVHVYGYLAPVKVKRVYADVYEIDYGSDVETQIVAKRYAHACYRRRLRAPQAPPESFRQVFCAWTGQTVKPEPARTALQQARENTLYAVRRLMYGHATIGQIDRHIDHVIREAKAEALAEREASEPKPYGRVLATAGATCHGYRREGDDVELTFKVRVPVHAAIACAPIHETNYRVTATSKGAV